MKKTLFLVIAIVAMAGFANAQSTLCRDVGCTCDSGIDSGPGSCDLVPSDGGACDSNRMCVNLLNDLANCGSLRHSCATGYDCDGGVCTPDGTGGDIGGIQPSTQQQNPPPLTFNTMPKLTLRKRPRLT